MQRPIAIRHLMQAANDNDTFPPPPPPPPPCRATFFNADTVAAVKQRRETGADADLKDVMKVCVGGGGGLDGSVGRGWQQDGMHGGCDIVVGVSQRHGVVPSLPAQQR